MEQKRERKARKQKQRLQSAGAICSLQHVENTVASAPLGDQVDSGKTKPDWQACERVFDELPPQYKSVHVEFKVTQLSQHLSGRPLENCCTRS